MSSQRVVLSVAAVLVVAATVVGLVVALVVCTRSRCLPKPQDCTPRPTDPHQPLTCAERLRVYSDPLYQTRVPPTGLYVGVDRHFDKDDVVTYSGGPESFNFDVTYRLTCATLLNFQDGPKQYCSLLIQAVTALLETGKLGPSDFLYLRLGDTPTRHPHVLVKARHLGYSGCLVPLDYNRHFGPIQLLRNVQPAPFENKIPKAIWRGVMTGNRRPFPRTLLVDRYCGSELVDAAFVEYPDCLVGPHRTAPFMDMAALLQYKYLVSVEGNDCATGLKWSLASNSVVLMCPPTVCTWFCETSLVPFVHFVPLAHNLDNVEEMVRWCERQPLSTLQEIIVNANCFVATFGDGEREAELVQQVVLASVRAAGSGHTLPSSKTATGL